MIVILQDAKDHCLIIGKKVVAFFAGGWYQFRPLLKVKYLVSEFECSVRQAEQLVDLSPGFYNYQPREKDENLISKQLLRIAGLHPEFGFERLHEILMLEGFVDRKNRFTGRIKYLI
ncbi:MAG: hypothetical protein D4R64_16695 [Porphyromonadaceae bacterium]|nr:MAG: hypothetical protein D4R64_16695 [Porphyromonadaceae bacterium]